MSHQAPIAVALDGPDLATTTRWAQQVGPLVHCLKVGLESYLRDGAPGVRQIRAAAPDPKLFLDLKLHDIPNTVAGAARSVAPLAPDYLTVHAAGGGPMISAAAEQLPATRITAVTVLTSMGAPALADLGWGHHHTVVELVVHLATQAVAAGARAIVCSPQEIQAVRQAVGPDIHLLTPGIRPAGPTARRDSTQGVAVSPADDQERVATPAQALQAGADLLVIGRPITAAADPAAAVAAMGFPL